VLRDAAGGVGMVILNPASGPGTMLHDGYRSATDTLRRAGVAVVGYVDTAYGTRAPGAVLAEVARHRRWYGVDGVFFDQVGIECSQLEHNLELARGARAHGCRSVVANAGATPCECLMDAADVIVSAENDARTYLDMPAGPNWMRRYDATRFCHLVYGAADAGLMRAVVSTARNRGVGWVFATPLPLGRLRSGDVPLHPWAGLPGDEYWAALLAAVGPDGPAGA
jgi:hypothetical protein